MLPYRCKLSLLVLIMLFLSGGCTAVVTPAALPDLEPALVGEKLDDTKRGDTLCRYVEAHKIETRPDEGFWFYKPTALQVVVKNSGQSAAGPSTVLYNFVRGLGTSFSDCPTPGSTDQCISDTKDIPEIAAGDQYTLPEVPLPDQSLCNTTPPNPDYGDCAFRVVVNLDHRIEEVSTNNNIIEGSCPWLIMVEKPVLPDLVAVSCSRRLVDDRLFASATIRNEGNGNAGPFVVNIDASPLMIIVNKPVNGLAAEDTVEVEYSYPIINRVTVDSGDQIHERREDNNQAECLD